MQTYVTKMQAIGLVLLSVLAYSYSQTCNPVCTGRCDWTCKDGDDNDITNVDTTLCTNTGDHCATDDGTTGTCTPTCVADGGDNGTPYDGGDNVTPGDGGDNVTPGDGDNNVTPGDGGDNVTPGDGGDNVTPDDGGNNVTPGDGGDNVTPGDGGDNGTPDDGGNNGTPDDGGDNGTPGESATTTTTSAPQNGSTKLQVLTPVLVLVTLVAKMCFGP